MGYFVLACVGRTTTSIVRAGLGGAVKSWFSPRRRCAVCRRLENLTDTNEKAIHEIAFDAAREVVCVSWNAEKQLENAKSLCVWVGECYWLVGHYGPN